MFKFTPMSQSFRAMFRKSITWYVPDDNMILSTNTCESALQPNQLLLGWMDPGRFKCDLVALDSTRDMAFKVYCDDLASRGPPRTSISQSPKMHLTGLGGTAFSLEVEECCAR